MAKWTRCVVDLRRDDLQPGEGLLLCFRFFYFHSRSCGLANGGGFGGITLFLVSFGLALEVMSFAALTLIACALRHLNVAVRLALTGPSLGLSWWRESLCTLRLLVGELCLCLAQCVSLNE